MNMRKNIFFSYLKAEQVIVCYLLPFESVYASGRINNYASDFPRDISMSPSTNLTLFIDDDLFHFALFIENTSQVPPSKSKSHKLGNFPRDVTNKSIKVDGVSTQYVMIYGDFFSQACFFYCFRPIFLKCTHTS